MPLATATTYVSYMYIRFFRHRRCGLGGLGACVVSGIRMIFVENMHGPVALLMIF
jgi:hypothetical protein